MTQSELKKILTYDPGSGKFFWNQGIAETKK